MKRRTKGLLYIFRLIGLLIGFLIGRRRGRRDVQQTCLPTQFGSTPPPFPSVSTEAGGSAVGSIRIVFRTVVDFGQAMAYQTVYEGIYISCNDKLPVPADELSPNLKRKLTGSDIRRETFLRPLFIFRMGKFLSLLKHLGRVKNFSKKRI